MSENNRWLVEHGKFVFEAVMAMGAAGVATYLRGVRDPKPLSRDSLVASAAEAVVCGFLAAGISAYFEWTDQRITYAIAGSLGMIGTATIREILLKITERKSGSL